MTVKMCTTTKYKENTRQILQKYVDNYVEKMRYVIHKTKIDVNNFFKQKSSVKIFQKKAKNKV